MTSPDKRIPIPELAILPSGSSGAALYRVQGDSLTWLETLPFGFEQRHALGGDRWIVAIIPETRKCHIDFSLEQVVDRSAYLYRAFVEHDGTANRFPDVPLPQLALNQTLALKGAVYLGGHERRAKNDDRIMGELAGYLDLRLENPSWNPLPLPVEMQEGKSIDDVLVYGNKLVLVDNII